jgi:hypothetical protein
MSTGITGTLGVSNGGTGVTTSTGSGSNVLNTSPTLVTPNLGTPSALVGTNITGTAASLTAGTVTTNANLTGEVTSVGNAATVPNATVIGKVLTGYVSGAGTVAATDTILQAIQKLNGNDATNANLTGPITSVGNATSVASQTGTGSTFVMNTSPTLVTPVLGTPSSGTLTSCTGLPLSTGIVGTLGVSNGGTGVTTSTGSGSNVLSNSPTLVTPALGTPSALVGTNITGTAAGLSIGGNAATATSATSATTATTATNLAGGAANQIVYQTGAGSTAYVTAPTLTNTSLTWNGSSLIWAAGAGGLVAGGGIFENSQTISVNYTITAGSNGMSTGPITVASGYTVTVPTGSRWVVL